MDNEYKQKYQTINHSSTHSKKRYFNGLKQKNEKPIKAPLNLKEIEKEKIKRLTPIRSVFNKSNLKIVSSILSFMEFKDIINLSHTNKYFHKLLTNKKILREYALSGVMTSENRILFYETLIICQNII